MCKELIMSEIIFCVIVFVIPIIYIVKTAPSKRHIIAWSVVTLLLPIVGAITYYVVRNRIFQTTSNKP